MRSRVSSNKRKKIIIFSAILLAVILIFLIYQMNSLTRKVLNNDRIAANVKCAAVTELSPDQVSLAKNTGKYENVTLDETLLKSVDDTDELCALKLEFYIKNFESRQIKNPDMKITPDNRALGKIYGASPMELISQSDGAMTFHRVVVLDKVDIDNSYFTEELPVNFDGPFAYELSYSMEGQYGTKTLNFGSALK